MREYMLSDLANKDLFLWRAFFATCLLFTFFNWDENLHGVCLAAPSDSISKEEAILSLRMQFGNHQL